MTIPVALARLALGASRASRASRISNAVSSQPIPVVSSAIAAVAYDQESEELTITFTGGNSYTYSDVPMSVYQGLMSAGSKGAYFNDNIIDNY